MRDQVFTDPWIRIADARYCYHDNLPQTGEYGIYELGIQKFDEPIRAIYIGHGQLYYRMLGHSTNNDNNPLRGCLEDYLEDGYTLYCRTKICWSDEAVKLVKSLKSCYLYDCNSFL